LSSASPYLQDAWVRWANRGSLMRRDVELVLSGFESKTRVLGGLRAKIQEHRRDDFAQLMRAHDEEGQRWDERLVRLGEWINTSENLLQSSKVLVEWNETAAWFDRAQQISTQFGDALERKIEAIEKGTALLGDRVRQWLNRLAAQEIAFAELKNRQGNPVDGLMVPAGRKSASLDFVYLEREEEGRLSLEFKRIREDIRLALHRLSRPETWVRQKETAFPAYVEIRKNQVFDLWRPQQKKLDTLSEDTLHLALTFEEGRKRLRGIYETIQKMKVLEPSPTTSKPLLHRLFNLKDD
jgi:hypothetical protein